MRILTHFLILGVLEFAFLGASSFAASERATDGNTIEIDRIENSTIYFKTTTSGQPPRPLKTDLHDLRPIGTLKSPDSPPYFIVSAKPCQNCSADSALYALRSGGGKPTSFVYPGRVLDPRTRAVLLESRAFFGRCLYRNKSDIYIVFQQERVDRRNRLQSSVFIAEPGDDHINERLIERGLPRLKDTLKLVRAKVCHEIEGRNRLMLNKPLDLTPRRGADTNEDDDGDDADEKPKENQTDKDLTPNT